ncbi:FAD-dependent oxidoreductase [Quadrisphaera sp. KR29]|uniref:FAD-dependent oxidoreductase n=1 Tax=Quadrisphaera sp. KR29 TaxID=3461391 RepID=UPI0040440E96
MAEDTDTTPDLTRGVRLGDLPLDGVLAGALGTGDDAEQVLLTRYVDDGGEQRVTALSATCTHVGAPLAKGLRTGDLVRCPFHHACFDLRTGEALLAPAYQPLTRYAVEVEGSGEEAVVRVTGRAGAPAPGPEAAGTSGDGALDRVVVVGGGAAGFAAVERLRREGYAGELVLVSAEPHPPIDRTQLSKFYLAGAKPKDALPLLAREWYDQHGVELRLGSEATVLDTDQKRLTVRAGDGATTVLGYDALVLAPGSEPVRPDLPGFSRDDVRLLRTLEDADALLAAVGDAPEQRRAVVLGAGFIGLEAAAVLREKGVDVTVVATSEVPLARQMGEDVGRAVRAAHEAEGVIFVTGRAVRWNDGVLELEDGTRAPAEGRADLLVVGTGVTPRLDLARRADLELADDDEGGGVVVDARGRTSADGVWAAGDVAAWPDATTGRRRRVEHWAQAQRQGAAAALDVLGRSQDGGLAEPAFFWTKQFSRQYRLAGEVPDLSGGEGSGSAEVDGSLAGGDAVVRYRDADGRVTAVAGVGRDLEVLRLEEELLRP